MLDRAHSENDVGVGVDLFYGGDDALDVCLDV